MTTPAAIELESRNRRITGLHTMLYNLGVRTLRFEIVIDFQTRRVLIPSWVGYDHNLRQIVFHEIDLHLHYSKELAYLVRDHSENIQGTWIWDLVTLEVRRVDPVTGRG
jgi:hypothetical protein